jgi:hypothetical protein
MLFSRPSHYDCPILLGWSAPALHLKAREAWMGWSPEPLRQRRHFLAQNSRLVLLADRQQFPNLATRALGLCCQRLSADWLAVQGHPIVAVESFVGSQLMFRGTAYKASGWTLLGPTAGFGRCAEDFYQRHDRPKQLWVRAPDREGTAALKAPSLPAHLASYEAPAPPRALSGKPLLSLLDRLPAVPEPRGARGRRHPWPAVLGIVCLAKLAGVAGAQRGRRAQWAGAGRRGGTNPRATPTPGPAPSGLSRGPASRCLAGPSAARGTGATGHAQRANRSASVWAVPDPERTNPIHCAQKGK